MAITALNKIQEGYLLYNKIYNIDKTFLFNYTKDIIKNSDREYINLSDKDDILFTFFTVKGQKTNTYFPKYVVPPG